MKKAVEIGAMLLLGIGFFLMVCTIGNVEFADLTHTVGFTSGQFWTRTVISFALMIFGVVIGNRANR